MNALLAWYFVAVWGSGYVATKIGLQYAPPFTFLTLRFGFGPEANAFATANNDVLPEPSSSAPLLTRSR